MGDGRILKCEKCGNSFVARTGAGFGFPQVYDKGIKDIKSGKYGENFKEIMLSRKDVVVDFEEYLFVCDKCGNWYTNYGFDFYVPKTEEEKKKVLKKDYYFCGWADKENYELFIKADHRCDKCKSEMRRISNDENSNDKLGVLKCPECDSELKEDGFMNWD